MADGHPSSSRQPPVSPLGPSHSRRARSASADIANAPLPSASDRGLTASDLIAHQSLLEQQAREAIPFSYTRASCTYEKGYIRQPLWACKTCAHLNDEEDVPINVCAGCSIGCHADHELVELFAKRDARCDCGMMPSDQEEPHLHPCKLRAPPQHLIDANTRNVYSRNHHGHFCYCEKGYTYDPLEEEETMFQCLVCEDWFHESCTSLTTNDIDQGRGHVIDRQAPLIAHESFDSFICDACVRENRPLLHYVGKEGWGACLEIPDGIKEEENGEQDKETSSSHPSPAEGCEGPSTQMLVEAEGQQPRKYLVVGLPANKEEQEEMKSRKAREAELIAQSDAESARMRANMKRSLSPIVERAGDDEAGPGSKRAKVEDSNDGDRSPGIIHYRPATPLPPGWRGHIRTEEPRLASRTYPWEATEAARRNLERPRSPSCRRPPIAPLVERLLRQPLPTTGLYEDDSYNPGNRQSTQCRLDVFLDEGQDEEEGALGESSSSAIKGWRKRLCRCSTCVAELTSYRHLAGILQEEETYEPPSSPHAQAQQLEHAGSPDDDAASSTSSSYDMAMSALSSLPRAQTLEAMQGYSRLKDALYEHLRPFAREGRMVDKSAITEFFED